MDVIEKGEIEKHLERVSVKYGDMIYISVGTVHDVLGGLRLIEFQ